MKRDDTIAGLSAPPVRLTAYGRGLIAAACFAAAAVFGGLWLLL